MKIEKCIKDHIERDFYMFEEYKAEHEQIRRGFISAVPAPPDGQPRGNAIAKPTEDAAVTMLTSVGILALERTISAIEWSLRSLTDEHRKVFRELYTKGRTDFYAVAIDLHASYDTLNRRRNELILAYGLRQGWVREV